MKTLAAFALLATALFAIGVAAVVIESHPGRDLFLPPPAGAYCGDAYVVRAAGSLRWLTLEGGMWEFDVAGTLYDLSGVERFLPAERIAWLQGHPGTPIPAYVEGVAEPCLATVHMRGVVVRVTALEV